MKTTVKTKPGKRLTNSQNLLLFWIIDTVTEAMEYDEDLGKYTDRGNFLLNLSANQLEELETIKKKLISIIDITEFK